VSIYASVQPTRVAGRFLEPTKFARLIPTDTPEPSDIPTFAPSATAVPSSTPTPTSTRKPNPPTIAGTATTAPTSTPPALSAQALTTAGSCEPIANGSYGGLSVKSPPTDRPAEEHPDLNLGLRGYLPTVAYTGFVDLGGDSDPAAPQMPGLFSDDRTPNSKRVYQVYAWNWSANTRGDLITDPPVSLVGVAVTPGELIHVPNAGNNIGEGEAVLVLYAATNRITLKYTGEDNVQHGYTLHVEGVCVEPRLLVLYQQLNAGGRGQLPALRAGQAFGRASGDELGIAIRDSGTFLDPRSRKDWWKGR
jgi:hypothetical protein